MPYLSLVPSLPPAGSSFLCCSGHGSLLAASMKYRVHVCSYSGGSGRSFTLAYCVERTRQEKRGKRDAICMRRPAVRELGLKNHTMLRMVVNVARFTEFNAQNDKHMQSKNSQPQHFGVIGGSAGAA